jgi:upstream activation factor subunit UAF30
MAKTKATKTDAPVAKKNENTKKKSTKKPKEDVVVEEVVEEVVDVDEVVEKKKSTRRPKPTRESVEEDFVSLIASFEDEISNLRETSGGKVTGVKFNRAQAKRTKILKNDCLKLIKKKKNKDADGEKTKSSNSGFKKPVVISKDMSKFAGWDTTELKSRVDVTQHLCNYVKEHELQNPANKREIIPDAKLKKLLGYDSKSEDPLTYFYLQKKIQQHFPKTIVSKPITV